MALKLKHNSFKSKPREFNCLRGFKFLLFFGIAD